MCLGWQFWRWSFLIFLVLVVRMLFWCWGTWSWFMGELWSVWVSGIGLLCLVGIGVHGVG